MKKMSYFKSKRVAGTYYTFMVSATPPKPTNRVGFRGIRAGDEFQEWSAKVNTKKGVLVAYYYLSNDEEQAMLDGDDDRVNWRISHYELHPYKKPKKPKKA